MDGGLEYSPANPKEQKHIVDVTVSLYRLVAKNTYLYMFMVYISLGYLLHVYYLATTEEYFKRSAKEEANIFHN